MLFVFYAVQFDDCFVLFVFVLKERRQALQMEIDKASQPDKTVKPTVGISVVCFFVCFVFTKNTTMQSPRVLNAFK